MDLFENFDILSELQRESSQLCVYVFCRIKSVPTGIGKGMCCFSYCSLA